MLFANVNAMATGKVHSWTSLKNQGAGNVCVFYYNSDHFISDADGELKGLEYDLFEHFFKSTEAFYGVKIERAYMKSGSFGMLYDGVKSGKAGEFGACSFSITKQRQNEVSFSPKYMPDIEVLITSQNIPVITDTSEFIRVFGSLKALSVPNTTFEKDLEWLTLYVPDLKIEDMEYASQIRERIQREENLFSYIELPNYLLSLKEEQHLKRQNMFKVERSGYGIIFPLSSDWDEPINRYFKSKEFKVFMNENIRKHFGDDVSDLIWKVSNDDNNAAEIDLLTKEREIQRLELQRRELDLKQERLLRIVLVLGGVIMVIVAFVFFFANRLKKKTNEQLVAQNIKIQEKNEIIAEKNENITASINYAREIQNVLLPDSNLLQKYFPEHFVLYKPKDIVSGDFYWADQIGDLLILVVADCTGHGVPGAFVSMMGHNFLNQIIRDEEITTPADALNKLNQMVNSAMTGKKTSKDGMDLIILSIDQKTNVITFSGAKNPLYYIHDGLEEPIRIAGDNIAIGSDLTLENSFTNHTLDLPAGTTIYMSTDGYFDQFGGADSMKFGRRRFRKMIQELNSKSISLEEQLVEVETELKVWQGEEHQIDDITMLAIRV